MTNGIIILRSSESTGVLILVLVVVELMTRCSEVLVVILHVRLHYKIP
jgi:hypothetical protein